MPWTTAAALSVELPPPVILKKRPEGSAGCHPERSDRRGAKSKDPERRRPKAYASTNRWLSRGGWGTTS